MASAPRSQPSELSQRAHQWGSDTKAPMNDLPIETVVVTNPGGFSGEDFLGEINTGRTSEDHPSEG